MSSTVKRVLSASILGIVVGGAAGFTLGLLVAPSKGKETRRRAAYLLDRWTQQVAGLLENAEAESIPQPETQRGQELVDKARKEAEKLKSEIEAIKRGQSPRGNLAVPPQSN